MSNYQLAKRPPPPPSKVTGLWPESTPMGDPDLHQGTLLERIRPGSFVIIQEIQYVLCYRCNKDISHQTTTTISGTVLTKVPVIIKENIIYREYTCVHVYRANTGAERVQSACVLGAE